MNENSKQMFFAAGASGGIAAPTALIGVAARALLANEPLQTALRTARIHHGGAPDMTYVEPETSREDVAYLVSRGHSVATTPKLGLVNAVSCTVGMPRDKDSCAVAADPRGHGIGMFVSE